MFGPIPAIGLPLNFGFLHPRLPAVLRQCAIPGHCSSSNSAESYSTPLASHSSTKRHLHFGIGLAPQRPHRNGIGLPIPIDAVFPLGFASANLFQFSSKNSSHSTNRLENGHRLDLFRLIQLFVQLANSNLFQLQLSVTIRAECDLQIGK